MHLLNLLRDSSYPFPTIFQSRLDFYGMTPMISKRPQQSNQIDESKKTILIHREYSLLKSGPVTIPPTDMDIVTGIYVQIQFKGKDFIDEIHLSIGSRKYASYSGDGLDIINTFEKRLMKITDIGDNIYEAWLELPYLITDELLLGLILDPMRVIINFQNNRFIKGKLIVKGKYCDLPIHFPSATSLFVRAQEISKVITTKWPFTEEENVINCKILRLLTGKFYIRVLDLDTDESLSIDHVIMYLNDHASSKFYGELLESRSNVYKLEFGGAMLNLRGIETIAFEVAPNWVENGIRTANWKISIIGFVNNAMTISAGTTHLC